MAGAAILHGAFGAPIDQFDPHQLRHLADDMLRWVNADPTSRVWITRTGA